MSDFNTVNPTDLDDSTDQFLIRQGTIDYKTSREILAASISNARWTSDADYAQGSEVTGSDGERYVALIANGASSTVADPAVLSAYWRKVSSKILSLLAGMRLRESVHGFDRSSIALKANGATYNRLDYPTLWALASSTAVTQSLITSSPTTYAANYGNGNGSSTFTVPNYTLMPYDATAGVYGTIGTVAEQQNLAHTHTGVVASRDLGTKNTSGYSHAHTYTRSNYANDNSGSLSLGNDGAYTNYSSSVDTHSHSVAIGAHNHDLTVNTSGASTLRPKTNFSDVWIIHGEVF